MAGCGLNTTRLHSIKTEMYVRILIGYFGINGQCVVDQLNDFHALLIYNESVLFFGFLDYSSKPLCTKVHVLCLPLVIPLLKRCTCIFVLCSAHLYIIWWYFRIYVSMWIWFLSMSFILSVVRGVLKQHVRIKEYVSLYISIVYSYMYTHITSITIFQIIHLHFYMLLIKKKVIYDKIKVQ